MIAVISDLHFEEESGDDLRGKGGEVQLSYPRNIPAEPYRQLIESLARAAQREGVERMTLVLAGDIFEFYQTSLWFAGGNELRPYEGTVQEGSPLEAKLLEILDAIADEEPVRETLELFRMLVAGRYVADAGERDFPVPVRIEYIPGNHDRPANATPALRRKVRQLLGMGNGGERFPNYLLLENPSALIRHGHEYDYYNFSADYRDADPFPLHIPVAEYDAPTFGDFITIDVVARLPVEYRRVHTVEGILSDRVKRAVYRRLLQFEDVRPQAALLSFILKTPKEGFTEAGIWETLEPVMQNIIEDVHDHPFLHHWIGEWEKKWRPDRMDLVKLALKVQSWRNGLSLPEARLLGRVPGQAQVTAVDFAAREEAVRTERVRTVVCGHTHKPGSDLVAVHGSRECYFIDVGTWRHRLPLSHDESGFGLQKSLTYLILYSSDEDRNGRGSDEKLESFDYWSGVIQRFGE
jgi:UDP-2,3-diacylglucosamine pyrophosphatase LpxH